MIRNRHLALLAPLVALAIAACGGSSGRQGVKPPVKLTAAQQTGRTLFRQNCGGCHTLGDAGTSGNAGPNLDSLQPAADLVEFQVSHGGGGMPSFGGRLSKTQIHDVAGYVSAVAGR